MAKKLQQITSREELFELTLIKNDKKLDKIKKNAVKIIPL